MIPNCKKSKPGQLNLVDRLSDLPDFILHHVISFLGTKEAYRTCILSKRWSQISATNPVLVFNDYEFSKENTQTFLEYVETRMQKYSKEKLCIRNLTFSFPTTSVELARKVDEWLEIAVHNQIVELVLRGSSSPNDYELPDILFTAKSLCLLECSYVKIPYYKTMDLASLVSLILYDVSVEDRMLNYVISSCLLLKELRLSDCIGFRSFVIPCCSKLLILDISDTLPIGGTVTLEASSLENITCMTNLDHGQYVPWPFISEAGFLRNLRVLTLTNVGITDDAFAKLLSELTLLETLVFWGCHLLNDITISSTQLKIVCINDCCSLDDVKIYAPNLTKFKFNGELDPSLSITVDSKAKCDISLHILPFCLDSLGFFKLKTLLTGLRNCSVLKISLLEASFEPGSDVIEFDEEELGNVHLGPPCNVRELKLVPSSWIPSESSLSAFLNGLFWTCHPDIISVRVHLRDPTPITEELFHKLEDMAKCWRHPLKRVEVEGANCSNLLKGRNRKVDLQLRLYW